MNLKKALLPGRLSQLPARLRGSSPASRLARGAVWSVLGAILSRGIALLTTILVARLLGKAAFGEYGMIHATLGVFGALSGFGLGLTANKHVAEFRVRDPQRAGRILGLSTVTAWLAGLLVAGAVALAAPLLAVKAMAAPHLEGCLRTGSLLVLLGSVQGAQIGALSGFEAFRPLATLSLWSSVANLVCVGVGCLVSGLPGAVWGCVVALTVACALHGWELSRQAESHSLSVFGRDWHRELPLLWRFSLPTTLASMLVAPATWYCQALLVRLPDGYRALADYTLGDQWRRLIQYLPGLLGSAYLPVIASIPHDQTGRRWRLMLVNTGLSTVVAGLTALPLFLVSDGVLAAYGRDFASAKWVLGLLVATGVVDAANNVLMQTLTAAGQAWLRLISNAVWAGLVLIAAHALIPGSQALGLAGAIGLAQALHLPLQFVLARRAIRHDGTRVPPA